MPKKHCTYCVLFYREKSPQWGRSSGFTEVPGCAACHRRYEGQVAKLESELEEQKKSYEAELSNQNATFQTQLSDLDGKTKVDSIMQRTNFDDYNREKSKFNFLKLSRDLFKGDVVFYVEGLEISADRIILAARSPVFRKMFQTRLPGLPRGVIQIFCVSAPVVEAAVNFCYTGEIFFGEIVPPDEVLKVAHIFEFEHLKDVCEAELCENVNVDNLSQLLKLSRTLGAVRLQNEANKFFKDHFDELKDQVYQIFEPGPAAATSSITFTFELGQ